MFQVALNKEIKFDEITAQCSGKQAKKLKSSENRPDSKIAYYYESEILVTD